METAQVAELTKDFQGAFGAPLVSLSLHGEGIALWWPATLVAVLSSTDAEKTLQGASGVLAKWRKRGLKTPLLLNEAELTNSLDCFPVEFFNLQLDRRVLSGADAFSGPPIDSALLRLQCERELKGKAIVMRQAFATSTLREEMEALASQSVPLFLGIFRTLLHLKGREVPKQPTAVLAAAAKHLSLDEAVFASLAEVAMGRNKKLPRESLQALMREYLRGTERLASLADGLRLDVKET
ncbi:MAG: hypothetical protein V2A77_03550 [Pseudomonadota bacterium]